MPEICPLCGADMELEDRSTIQGKGPRKFKKIKLKCTECSYGTTRVI